MPIVQNGSINTNALIVPDAYVQIVAPSITQLNGVPTNIIAIAGSAAWGADQLPQPFSDYGGGSRAFGPLKARKYDMLTQAACAIRTGANNFLGVRVTDATDVAALALVLKGVSTLGVGGTGHVVGDLLTLSNGAVVRVVTVASGVVATFTTISEPTAQTSGSITQTSTTGTGAGFTSTWTYTVGATATSKYTGSGANADTLIIAAGSQASTYKATVGRPGRQPEVYDNIGGAANASWVNLAAAINAGQAGSRGPSEFIVITAGAATAALTLGTYTLAGGTDGASGVTPAMLLGTDGTVRTGIYAVRNTLASIGILADADDGTTAAAQIALGLAEGIYMMLVGVNGQSATAGATAKLAIPGADSYARYLLGDWAYFNDNINGQSARMVSPQGFAAGRLANLAPQETGLNKPISGIVATQRSLTGIPYSSAELTVLANAGIDVVSVGQPGGSYFGLRMGRNGSSNPLIHGDNYTRMTNYIADTLNTGVGRFVGELQTADQRADAQASISSLFENMATGPRPMIGNPQRTQPYQVVLDDTNNPSRVQQGIEQCDVRVQYLAVVEDFVVNVEGGQYVQINKTSTLPLAA